MPRYFFHIFNCDGAEIFDDTGTELRNVDEVRGHMLATATSWIERGQNQDKHWSLEARDEDENIVGMVRFGVEPASGSPGP